MTAGPQEDARATEAVTAGEAAAHTHETAAEAQHAISGSDTAIEDAATPDSHAVGWFGSNVEPRGVTAPQSHSPNVSTPTDNSQSQG